MSDLHIHILDMRNKIVTFKFQVGVENSNKIWIDVSFHLQEPLQQLFFEKPPHIIQLLTLQPAKRDNFWVVYHFSTCFKAISLNQFIVSWEPTLKMSSWSHNPGFNPFLCRRSGIHENRMRKGTHTKESMRCINRWANGLFLWRKTVAEGFIAKQNPSLILWLKWVSVFKVQNWFNFCTEQCQHRAEKHMVNTCDFNYT